MQIDNPYLVFENISRDSVGIQSGFSRDSVWSSRTYPGNLDVRSGLVRKLKLSPILFSPATVVFKVAKR